MSPPEPDPAPDATPPPALPADPVPGDRTSPTALAGPAGPADAAGAAPSAAKVAAEAAELARMAVDVWLRGAERTVASGLAAPARFAAISLRGVATTAGNRVGRAVDPAPLTAATSSQSEPPSLRDRGGELLRRSADIHESEDSHPAYRRILDDLAPDEARILRLLAGEGPQPSVDIRAGFPPATRRVSGDFTLVASDAGCRLPERIQSYLDNLGRLGLVAVHADALRDPTIYQLLEAQPDVVAALKAAGRTARTDRRSIGLTSFGQNFCRECLPLEP